MGHPDGAHTHGSSGSGLGAVVAVGGGVLLLAAAMPAIVAIIHALVVAVVVVAAVAVAGAAIAGTVALRARRRSPASAPPVLWRQRQPQGLSEPQSRPALGQGTSHNHVHFHGLHPEQVAAILRQLNERD